MAYFPPQAGKVLFDQPDGTWERDGECCRCGECCGTGDPFNGEEGVAQVEGYCPIFAWGLDGLGECTNRGHSYYLGACVSWPSHPSQIEDKPSCTYTFKKVSGD